MPLRMEETNLIHYIASLSQPMLIPSALYKIYSLLKATTCPDLHLVSNYLSGFQCLVHCFLKRTHITSDCKY